MQHSSDYYSINNVLIIIIIRFGDAVAEATV